MSVEQRYEEATEGYAPRSERPLRGYMVLMGVFNVVFLAAFLAARRARGGLPTKVSATDVLLIGTATHKASRLLTKEKVTSAVRAPFTRFQGAGAPGEVEEKPRGSGLKYAVGELLVCPYCVAHWIASIFIAGLATFPRATRIVAAIFTATAISDFLQLAYRQLGQRR